LSFWSPYEPEGCHLGIGNLTRSCPAHPGQHELDYLRSVATQLGTRLDLLRLEQDMVDRQNREAVLQQQVTEARLRALRAQINPHFLFNLLNTIASLIATDPPRAEVMTVRLARVFRHVLANSSRQRWSRWSERTSGAISDSTATASETRFLDIRYGARSIAPARDQSAGRVRQHVRKTRQGARSSLRRRRVGCDQAGDGVQRIEQKVRVDLSAKRAELGFGDLLLQDGFTILAIHHILFEAQEVEPGSELGGDGAKIVEFVADQGAPGSSG